MIRVEVPAPLPITLLETNQAYTVKHGSIEGNLITRALHTHGLLCDVNKTVYFKLEEATRTTQYADTIKPFSEEV